MRYSNKAKAAILKYLAQHTLEETSSHYDIPIPVLDKWQHQNMDEEHLADHLQQKFYDTIPQIEAQITSLFSIYLDDSTTDNEFEALSSKVDKIIFNTIMFVYKSYLKDNYYERADTRTEYLDILPEKKNIKKPINIGGEFSFE